MEKTLNGAMKPENTKNLYDLMTNAAELYGDKTFLRYQIDDVIYEKSYAELARDAKKIAAFIDEECRAYSRKLHCALLGRSSYDYLCAMMGTVCAGAAAIPMDVQLANEKLLENLDNADTDILFYDWEFRSQASYVMERCEKIHQCICLQEMAYIENIINILDRYDGETFTPDISPEQLALIIFTSGTTGTSKGVMLSHANAIDNTFCSDNDNPGEEVFLGILPIHHVFCINSDVFMVMRYGNTLCISHDIKHMLRELVTFEPTFLRAVPAMLKAMINRVTITRSQNPDMSLEDVKKSVWGSRLKKIASGGGYLSPDIAHRFMEVGIKIGQGYGMSECSPKISVPDYDRPDKVESIGRPVRNCQIRIQDGEIQVKSPSVMMGYYNNEEATKETLTEDGWLCTGDLGHLDEDGFLYLTGRKKNLIILSNGENVSPEGIENRFDEDLLVIDILVYSQGEQIVAEVYPNYEYAQLEGINDIQKAVEELVDKHNADLPTYSRISGVVVRRHPFEKTSSSKIIRSKFFDKQKETAERKKTIKKPESELAKQIFEIVKGVIGREDFGVDEDLFEQGLDSLGSFMLIDEFEAKLGYNIAYNELMNATTIEKIEAVCLEKAEAAQIDYSKRDKYPLTGLMKYFGYIIPGNTTGNLPFTFRLDDSISLERMQHAISTVLDAHPAVKAKIYPDETGFLALYRNDERKVTIPIEKISDEEWETIKDTLVVAFAYTKEDDLFHIRLFETPTSKYLLFDVAHIVSDGTSMNILLEDLNKAYVGEPLETEEKYSFFEYLVDYMEAEKKGEFEKSAKYFGDLMKGLRLSRSVLNKKGKQDLNHQVNGHLRARMNLVVKEINYFCERNGISENVLFLSAFNYTMALFSNEKDMFTYSIHSGRTDGRWRRLGGCLFMTYYTRYNVIPHETTVDLLRRNGRQVMDTMKCKGAVPFEGEMFFQYQSDLIRIPNVGDKPAETIHFQLDSLPFHFQVMRDENGWYYELRYWENRFDREQLKVFLACYESIVRAMAIDEERSARRLKKHIPEELFPKHYKVSAKELSEEAGESFFNDTPDDEEVAVYVMDDQFLKKPFGAWGRLYVLDKEPAHFVDELKHPEKRGHKLFDTGITARILPDGRIDFLDNSGRVILTEGTKGRYYYDLGALERLLSPVKNVAGVNAFLSYSPELNDMTLEMIVDTKQNSFINELCRVAGEGLGKDMVPATVSLRMTSD